METVINAGFYHDVRRASVFLFLTVPYQSPAYVSNTQLVSRWDNAMNIMDAAVAMSDPDLRASLDSQVEQQTQKDIAKRKKQEQRK